MHLDEHVLIDTFAENELPISQIKSMSAVGGGCIHNSILLQTNRGPFFLKWNEGSLAFSQLYHENLGLSYLRNKKNIHIPEVYFLHRINDLAILVMEYIEKGNPEAENWGNFGRSMAELHMNSHEKFGFNEDNFIGSLPQSNAYKESWSDFYINERIEPMLKMANDSGYISPSLKKGFNNFYRNLNDIFPEEKSALIHGDLWSGNFMFHKNGNPYVFDPAVYYGHREMELSFMKLFGGFSPLFFKAYEEEFPLENQLEKRVPYYNLYPLLVHVNLFGSSYLEGIKSALKDF